MIRKALCGDIGGTNANFGVANYNDGIHILEESRKPTANYSTFTELVLDYLDGIDSEPEAACLAVAGPVQNQRVKMTNSNLVVDAVEISHKTGLKDVLLINDFDAVGYATNVLEPYEVVVINRGKPAEKENRAAIGAGTGLGKSVLMFDKSRNAYIPHASEGGHTDFPILVPEEFSFFENFVHPTYEDLLSGRGLEILYKTLQQKKYPEEPDMLPAMEISQHRHTSACCRETFELFVKFFARCAKNFSIDILARGGIFIAGGIAAANHDMFKESFMEEFTRHSLPQFSDMLKNIPVTLIKNYGISLKGAAFAMTVHLG